MNLHLQHEIFFQGEEKRIIDKIGNNVFDLNFLFGKRLKNFDGPVYRMRNEEN